MNILSSAIGVYAVASFSAGARRRELAVRAALGATRRDLIGRTLREELWPITGGIVIGSLAAMAVTPRLGALLFRVSPFDPQSYALACVALVAAALVASYLPARRAGRSDPVELLRM